MTFRALSLLGLFLAASACDSTAPPPADGCVENRTLSIGATVSGIVSARDCAIPDEFNRHGDSYGFTLTTQSTISLTVSGDTEMILRIRDRGRATNQEVAYMSARRQYGAFAVLKAGSYSLDLAAYKPDASGNYTLTAANVAPPLPAGCIAPPGQMVFATVGVTVQGELTSGDCQGSGTTRSDTYTAMFPGGTVRTITVTTSSTSGGTVEVRFLDIPTSVVVSGTRSTPGDIVVQVSPITTYYTIAVMGSPGSGTITYTLRIE